MGRKEKYYVHKFNPSCDLQQKSTLKLAFHGDQRFIMFNEELTHIKYGAKGVGGKDLKKLEKNGCELFVSKTETLAAVC